MANVVLPFLLSMLLGRTIDLRTYTISGSNIYDDAEYEETRVGVTNSTYHVIQDNSFPYQFFGMPLDIVLRIKSNFLSSASGAMGLDGLLKDTSWKHNSVVVSVVTVHRTVDRKLRSDSSPLPDWPDKVPLGQTHYADSFSYGGWTVVLFRFQCDIPKDVEAVRRVLTRHLGVAGTLRQDIAEKWRDALAEISTDSDIRGTITFSTHLYSTVELKEYIDSPESLLRSLEELPQMVGPLGQPLFMNLKPLHQLDERYQEVSENVDTLEELHKLDEMLDDVRDTKVRVMRWMEETLTAFDEEQEERISSMLNILNKCLRAFNQVSSKVSLFSAMDRSLLDNAYHLYLSNLEKGLPNYNIAYRRLKEEVDADCEDAFLHRIAGLLRISSDESRPMGRVAGGLQECQQACYTEQRCRAIGYADEFAELDMATGLYLKREKQCWIYFRSTGTATVYTPNEFSGDMGVYDRKCY